MREKVYRLVACAILLTVVQTLSAKCGNVDYSWGAEALAKMHDYVVTMMMSVLYLIYAIASIVAIVSSFQIYYKMQIGEEGVTKNITMLIGAILFIIGASVVLPAFFGYRV
jgi:hypothetical protein